MTKRHKPSRFRPWHGRDHRGERAGNVSVPRVAGRDCPGRDGRFESCEGCPVEGSNPAEDVSHTKQKEHAPVLLLSIDYHPTELAQSAAPSPVEVNMWRAQKVTEMCTESCEGGYSILNGLLGPDFTGHELKPVRA